MGKVYSFLYGESMTLTGKNGQSYTVFQPGNTIDTTGGTTTIRATNANDVNAIMAALTNGNTSGTGTPDGNTGTGPQPGSKYTAVETLSLQDLISDANTDQIQGDLDKQEGAKTPTDTTDNPPPTDTTDNPPPTDTTTTRRRPTRTIRRRPTRRTTRRRPTRRTPAADDDHQSAANAPVTVTARVLTPECLHRLRDIGIPTIPMEQ